MSERTELQDLLAAYASSVAETPYDTNRRDDRSSVQFELAETLRSLQERVDQEKAEIEKVCVTLTMVRCY